MASFFRVENLSKSFQVRKKSSFMKGLLNPEFHTVQAVDMISFSLNAERVAFVGQTGGQINDDQDFGWYIAPDRRSCPD